MEKNRFLQVEELEFVPIAWELLNNDDALELEIVRLNNLSRNAFKFI